MSTMARAGWVVAGACTLAMSTPGTALSQFAPLAPVNAGDRITQVDLIADLIYDSNVGRSNPALSTARRLKPSDLIVVPQIRLQFARPIGRQTVYLLGSAAYTNYARNGILDREDISINPGALGQISRCEYDVSGSYSRAQSDLDALALTPSGPVLLPAKNTLQVEGLTGGANCGRAVGLAPTVRVSQTWAQNSSVVQRGVNVNSFSTQDGISYRRPSFGSLSLFGAYSSTTYPERSIIDILFGLPAQNVGYKTYSGGISYTRPIGARLVGSASISYTDLQNIAPGEQGFSGLTYSAALSYSVTPRLLVSTNISRATVPSNRLNSSFKIDELYSVEADYQVTRRASLRTGVSYEHEDYGGITVVRQFDLTQEKISTGYFTAQYQVNRILSVSIGVDQSHRDANFPGLTYDDTRATLGVKTSF